LVKFALDEARAWTRENLRGVANVVIASYNPETLALNEAGIRHDIRREIELGYVGTLMVSETALTIDEYIRMIEVSADEADGRLILIHHASFNTLEENVAAIQRAEKAGAELALLSYPPSFYPENENDIYEYTRAVCSATSMGVILFPVPLWDFERIHPACLSMDLMERLLDDIPNIVAIKAEGGVPSVGGFAQAWNRFSDQVVVTMPLVHQAIPLATLVPMQVIATSNSEYFGDSVPRMMQLVQEGRQDEAMEIFWRLDPALRANNAVADITTAGHIVHRWAWKYQAWLNGFNGGPLRMPTARLTTRQMRVFRQALVEAGVDVTPDMDELYLQGRVK
jgi:4-hydroxy-tetrahydrodipicolinate synthase